MYPKHWTWVGNLSLWVNEVFIEQFKMVFLYYFLYFMIDLSKFPSLSVALLSLPIVDSMMKIIL